jgi:hypothetical protein
LGARRGLGGVLGEAERGRSRGEVKQTGSMSLAVWRRPARRRCPRQRRLRLGVPQLSSVASSSVWRRCGDASASVAASRGRQQHDQRVAGAPGHHPHGALVLLPMQHGLARCLLISFTVQRLGHRGRKQRPAVATPVPPLWWRPAPASLHWRLLLSSFFPSKATRCIGFFPFSNDRHIEKGALHSFDGGER